MKKDLTIIDKQDFVVVKNEYIKMDFYALTNAGMYVMSNANNIKNQFKDMTLTNTIILLSNTH